MVRSRRSNKAVSTIFDILNGRQEIQIFQISIFRNAHTVELLMDATVNASPLIAINLIILKTDCFHLVCTNGIAAYLECSGI